MEDKVIAEPVLIADKGIWHPLAESTGQVYDSYEAYQVCIGVHVCLYVCKHICTFVCMYVCACTYIDKLYA